MTDLIDIECRRCDGNGFIEVYRAAGILRGHHQVDCPDCAGHGWRLATEDEISDMSANAFSDMCESEPPMTAAERHVAAHVEKQIAKGRRT